MPEAMKMPEWIGLSGYMTDGFGKASSGIAQVRRPTYARVDKMLRGNRGDE